MESEIVNSFQIDIQRAVSLIKEGKSFEEIDYVLSLEGKEYLAALLIDGDLFFNGEELFLNCSDVFAWGFVDAEKVTLSEIFDIFRNYAIYGKYGAIIYCCKKRKEQPQAPVKKWLIEGGVWNDELEALPINNYDELIKKRVAEQKEGIGDKENA